MTKGKQFLKKDKKKSKHVAAAPATADEYLAAGVDFEEAGEKWRGGDAVKSARFFVKAIDCYDEALKKFPTSFDLAYNKARVQYDLTQHPKLLDRLPVSLLDLLQTSLESSRYALKLNPENPEISFNTAQILTSIVEAIEPNSGIDPLAHLEEALKLFETCLSLQESQAPGRQTQVEIASEPDPEPEEWGGFTVSQSEEERWASVLEPITNDTLLDTLVAQLQTLTLLCSLLPPSEEKTLQYIQNYAGQITTSKLAQYTEGTGREGEAALAEANITCTFADLSFRSSQLPLDKYKEIVASAYNNPLLATDPEALCDAAEAYMKLNSYLRASQDPNINTQNIRWNLISKALTNLTNASKLPGAQNLASIHIARGDAELHRWQMGYETPPYGPAQSNATVLIDNASKFYSGASRLLSDAKETISRKDKFSLTVKSSLLRGLQGIQNSANESASQASQVLWQLKDDVVGLYTPELGAWMVFADMIEEGLITPGQLDELGLEGEYCYPVPSKAVV